MLLYRRQHLIANSFSIRREKGERVGNTVSRLEIQFQTGQVTPMTDERWAVPQQGSEPPFRCRPFCWPMPFPNTYLSQTFSPLLSTRTGACWRLFAWIRGFFQIRTFSLSLSALPPSWQLRSFRGRVRDPSNEGWDLFRMLFLLWQLGCHKRGWGLL